MLYYIALCYTILDSSQVILCCTSMYISNVTTLYHYYYTYYLLCIYIHTLCVFMYIHTYIHTYIHSYYMYRYGAERRAEPEALSAEAANSNSVEGTALPGTSTYYMVHIH